MTQDDHGQLEALLGRVRELALEDGATWVLDDDDPVPAGLVEALRKLIADHSAERYQPAELLGRGGVAEVCSAYDKQLGRPVAMKVLLRESAASVKRFTQEARVTGQLDHPGIVPVHELGRDADGRLFFTMRQVRGDALDEALRKAEEEIAKGELSYGVAVVRNVEILRRVCDAVAFAHARGVVHRDLKPANVMVGSFGEVQVMDWGLARLLDDLSQIDALVTDGEAAPSPQVAGTPAYMAPEQARGLRVGPRTDVYALGALLYEMLTFRCPFDGELRQVLNDVCAGRFQRPADATAHPVPPELEAIVLRAMALESDARYGSVEAFSGDLQAWLEGRPLATLTYGPSELVGKWARRNRPVVVAVAATVGIGVLLGAGGLARYIIDIRHEREVANDEAELAARAESDARLALARGWVSTADAWAANDRLREARDLYEKALPALQVHDASVIGAEIGLWTIHHRSRTPLWEASPPQGAAWGLEPGRGWLLDAREGAPLVGRDVFTGQPLWSTEAAIPCVPTLVRPEGDGEHYTHVVYCGEPDGTVLRFDAQLGATEELYEVDDVRVLFDGGATGLFVYSADPLASVRYLWSDGDGWHSRSTRYRTNRGARGHSGALGTYPGPLLLVDLRTGNPLRTLDAHFGTISFSRDGKRIGMFYEQDERLEVQNAAGEAVWSRHVKNAGNTAFSWDASTIYTAGLGRVVHVLDARSGERLSRLEGHADTVESMRPLVSGLITVDASNDWILWPPSLARPIDRVREQTTAVAFSSDGRLLAAGSQTIRVFDIATGEVLVELPTAGDETNYARHLQFSPDGAALLVNWRKMPPVAFDLLEPTKFVQLPAPAHSARWLDDGRFALVSGEDLVVADAAGRETWRRVGAHTEKAWDVVSHDGALYTTGHRDSSLTKWQIGTQDPLWTVEGDGHGYDIGIAPTGDKVAWGTWEGSVHIASADGELLHRLHTAEGPILASAFSQDGSLLATVGWDYAFRIYEIDSETEVHVDTLHDGKVADVAWHPGGRIIASGSVTGLLLRDLELGVRVDEARGVLQAGLEATLDGKQDVDQLELADALSVLGAPGRAAEVRAEVLATGLDGWLAQARDLWRDGQLEAAAEAFARAEGEAPTAYLALCRSTVRR